MKKASRPHQGIARSCGDTRAGQGSTHRGTAGITLAREAIGAVARVGAADTVELVRDRPGQADTRERDGSVGETADSRSGRRDAWACLGERICAALLQQPRLALLRRSVTLGIGEPGREENADRGAHQHGRASRRKVEGISFSNALTAGVRSDGVSQSVAPHRPHLILPCPCKVRRSYKYCSRCQLTLGSSI
jgi:hypothetical protein